MVITKKLRDLTHEELIRCGWIEKIAFRGATDKTMFDFESETFNSLRRDTPEVYEQYEIRLGEKWFVIYLNQGRVLTLTQIAKMDIGKGQEEAKREIEEFTKEVFSSNKVVYVRAREETSYYSFVKAAANGEICIVVDQESGVGLREIAFVNPANIEDLSKQKIEYQKKLDEFIKNKDNHKALRNSELKHFIEELEATIGKEELRKRIGSYER